MRNRATSRCVVNFEFAKSLIGAIETRAAWPSAGVDNREQWLSGRRMQIPLRVREMRLGAGLGPRGKVLNRAAQRRSTGDSDAMSPSSRLGRERRLRGRLVAHSAQPIPEFRERLGSGQDRPIRQSSTLAAEFGLNRPSRSHRHRAFVPHFGNSMATAAILRARRDGTEHAVRST